MGRRRGFKLDIATAVVQTREEAAMAGRPHYFTGKPCANGHLAYRYVSNMSCMDCRKPPPIVTPYMGDHFTHLLAFQLRARGVPSLAEMPYAKLACERALDAWLVLMGYVPKRKEVE
jgi:hypothetical protein